MLIRLLFVTLASTAFVLAEDDGIPLERLGAMLEAARMVEEANGGTTVDLMEFIEKGDAAVSDDLDRYSRLLDSRGLREARIQHRGEFVGVGIRYRHRGDHLFIISVFPDGPAAKAGLLAGDRITAVEDETIASLGRDKAVERLRGRNGTRVAVTVARGQKTLSLTITRGRIELPAVSDAKMLTDDVGYLRLVEFHGNAEKQLVSELRKLRAEGMRRLVLDLRGNPGGATNSSVRIAGLFLPRGSTVAIVREDDKPPEKTRTRNHNRRLAELPLVCLIDGATASAAEILAAALRDNGRARLLGQRTFGKGSGQETTRLIDGSAMKLTRAEYLTPKGDPIHDVGIAPDVVIDSASNRDWLDAAIRMLAD